MSNEYYHLLSLGNQPDIRREITETTHSNEDLRRNRYPEDLMLLANSENVEYLYRLVLYHDDPRMRVKALHFLVILANSKQECIRVLFESNRLNALRLLLKGEFAFDHGLRKGIIILMANLALIQSWDDILDDFEYMCKNENDETVRYHAFVMLSQFRPEIARQLAKRLLTESSISGMIFRPFLEQMYANA